jgi:hypothetical protein
VPVYIFDFKDILFTFTHFWRGPQVGAGDRHRVQEQGHVVELGGARLMALNILQISWIRFGPCVPIDYESGTFSNIY